MLSSDRALSPPFLAVVVTDSGVQGLHGPRELPAGVARLLVEKAHEHSVGFCPLHYRLAESRGQRVGLDGPRRRGASWDPRCLGAVGLQAHEPARRGCVPAADREAHPARFGHAGTRRRRVYRPAGVQHHADASRLGGVPVAGGRQPRGAVGGSRQVLLDVLEPISAEVAYELRFARRIEQWARPEAQLNILQLHCGQ